MTGFPFGEPVTVLRPGATGRDIYGNDLPGPDAEQLVPGCVIAPAGPPGEVTDGRDTVTEALAVYLPVGTDVRPTDRIRIRGEVFEVHGAVTIHRSPFTGQGAGVHLTARRTTG
ncbi:hypothetical protein [Streptomyces sp. NPDC053079]|uniref:hypothetical protein n=1 Tax=Streptomyces sp. NPDC053079 TaxID=3365697 RepID=UPI0037D3F219